GGCERVSRIARDDGPRTHRNLAAVGERARPQGDCPTAEDLDHRQRDAHGKDRYDRTDRLRRCGQRRNHNRSLVGTACRYERAHGRWRRRSRRCGSRRRRDGGLRASELGIVLEEDDADRDKRPVGEDEVFKLRTTATRPRWSGSTRSRNGWIALVTDKLSLLGGNSGGTRGR